MDFEESSIYNQIDFELLRTKLYNLYENIAKNKPSQWSICEDILNADNGKLLSYAYLNKVDLLDCYVKRSDVKKRVRGPKY